MKIAIIALTKGALQLADTLSDVHKECFVDRRDLSVFEKITDLWNQRTDAIVCIMATGIVVRGLATLCSDKTLDPCVLVLDERGKFVISLLSGHLGGGNQLAKDIAEKIGGQAVITTASDVTGHTALDLWARKNRLHVENSKKLTEKSAKLINNGTLQIFCDCEIENIPDDFILTSSTVDVDIIISDKLFVNSDTLFLRPESLSVGLGCNRGTAKEDFETAIAELFADTHLALASISCFASIDLKEDEQGMLDFVKDAGSTIQFYTKEHLNSVDDVSSSAVVFAATGAKGVAEPAALLAAGIAAGIAAGSRSAKLIVRKRKWKDVTVAVARKKIRLVA